MLEVTIAINGRVIGFARARNVSELTDVSDYEVVAGETASPVTGLADARTEFAIVGHERRQTAWALVEKIAREMVARRSALREK